ncbi:uncharacterized protein LOC132560725 [Ylistrum balloti]|uniref:uncharacterized protein LOC132560725 n=1 Tax=Ylistrum balloti TaxID=509963 RepID=UPI002905BD13|nr:uncharacterized protein LOC132560725 [Ylistrum balloti]
MAEKSKKPKDQTEVKITKSVMQNNWGRLKEIRFTDIVDTLIERYLISIDESREFRGKTVEHQQMEALLYVVFKKSQDYLDKFFAVLAEKGYNHIVQILKDQAAKTSNRDSKLDRDVVPKKSLSLIDEIKEMQVNFHQLQMKAMQDLFKLLKRDQSEQMLELRKHFESVIEEKLTDLRQNEEKLREAEKEKQRLKSCLQELQKKLDLKPERRRDTVKTNKEFKGLQRENDRLIREMDIAMKKIKKLEHDNKSLRDEIKEIHRKQIGMLEVIIA